MLTRIPEAAVDHEALTDTRNIPPLLSVLLDLLLSTSAGPSGWLVT